MARRILNETTKSTFVSDDYLYMDGQTDGASKITPDNLVRNTTVAQQLAQHIADAEEEVEQITGDIETIHGDITDVKSDIGDLEDLETTDKSSLVNAINEAASSGGGGSIDTLTDVELTNLSNGQALTYDSTDQVWKNVTLGGGGSITIDSALSSTSENPVQNKVITNALNAKSDREWTYLPHRTNPAVDAHNSYSLENAEELGTASTLRHNLMLESNWNTGYFVATWTESTGNKDYAESSGETSVYAVCYRDKFGTRQSDTDSEILISSAVDVFPHGNTVYDGNGNAVCTIVAASDSTVKKRSSDYIFIGTVYGSDNQYHIVYRTGNTTSTPSISLDATINVLQINGAEWDMTTLRQDYTQKTSQLNTYIILRQNFYYMAIAQNGVGVAIMKSSDCIDWELQAHIPDTDAHLEACLCVTPWVSNNMPTVFVAVRHNYGDGYITLHSYNGLDFATKKDKVYIPASTGRPMMFSDSNAKQAYLCFSVNGRHNAVVVRISGNNDGTTAYNLFTTLLDKMSNYPVMTTNGKFILFGGTNGLGSDKNGVSICPIWSEELTSYGTMSGHLLDVVEHGAFVANFTSADEGKFLTIDSNGDIVATAMSTWSGGSY